MLGLLALLFLVVPFVELFVILQVSHLIGGWLTVLVLAVVSVAGAWLVKREGMGVWRRARAQVQQGSVPGAELIDGVLILVGGALLLTPGFLTDSLGLLLLAPPVRAGLRAAARRRLAHRLEIRSW